MANGLADAAAGRVRGGSGDRGPPVAGGAACARRARWWRAVRAAASSAAGCAPARPARSRPRWRGTARREAAAWGRSRAQHAGDQLLAEALEPLLRVRRPLAQADVQRLARVGPWGQDRVVAQQLRVAVGGALLEPPADLADEAASKSGYTYRADAACLPLGASRATDVRADVSSRTRGRPFSRASRDGYTRLMTESRAQPD